MRWKIQIIDLGSKRKRKIKKLREYIDGIGAKIQIFVSELEEENEKIELTAEEKLSKTGDFICKLQKEILEFRKNKYQK